MITTQSEEISITQRARSRRPNPSRWPRSALAAGLSPHGVLSGRCRPLAVLALLGTLSGLALAPSLTQGVDASTLTQQNAARSPGVQLTPADLPPGLDAETFAPRPSDDAKAWLSVDEAIKDASGDFKLPETQTRNPLTADTFRQVADLYRQAREQYIEGKYFESIRTLEKGLKLDPGSSAMLGLMAQNYQTTIGPARALQYYEDVLRYDPNSVEALYRVGSAAWQRRDVKQAATDLGRAMQILVDPDSDQGMSENDLGPEMELVVRNDLGAVLMGAGYDAASITVWQRLIDIMPDSPPLSARYQPELDRLYRSQTTIEEQVGDAHMRLKQFDAAQEDYQDALANASSSQSARGLLSRLVWAQIEDGKTADAVATISNAISRSVQPGANDSTTDNNENDEVLGLVRFVAQRPESKQLVELIQTELDKQPGRLELVQALSVLLPGEKGDKVLMDFLAKHGGDENAARALLPWFISQNNPDKTLRFILNHAVQTHTGAQSLVQELIDRTSDAKTYLKSWTHLPSDLQSAPEAALVRAELMQAAFDWTGARSELEQAVKSHPDFAAAQLSLASLLTHLGLNDDAMDIMDNLKSTSFKTSNDFYAAAQVWSRLGDDDKAWAAMQDLGKATNLVAPLDQTRYLDRQADLQLERGNRAEAITLWQEAIKTSPDDDDAYASLIKALAPQPGNQSQRVSNDFVNIVRALYSRLPQSRAFRMLQAAQDNAQGHIDDAIAAYKQLISEDGADTEPMLALLQTMIASNRSDEAVQYFDGLVKSRPGDREVRRVWLQALVATRQVDAAVTALRKTLTDSPGDIDTWSTLAEIDKAAGRTADAQDALMQRWMQMPESVARALALAQITSQQGHADEARTFLAQARDIAARMPPHHGSSLVITALQIAQKSPGPEIWTFVRDVVQDMMNRKEFISPAVSFAMIHAIIELNEPLSDLQASLKSLRDILPDSALDQTTLAVATLAKEDRISEAAAVADTWLGADRPFEKREANLIDWRLNACAQSDEPDRALTIIRRVHESHMDGDIRFVADTSQVLGPPGNAGKNGTDDSNAGGAATSANNEALANLIYIASGHFSALGHDASQEKLLEAALKIDPDHAMANNDLAYTWVDRNENLEQAERMLVISVKAEPNSSAALDSLGWTRYKLGKLTDPSDDLTKEGAIKLLEQAAMLRKGERPSTEDDPVILDHLGDAYWRAKRSDDAVNAWKRGLNAYNAQLDLIRKSADTDTIKTFTDYYKPYADGLDAKIKAAADGKQPSVAYCPALDKDKGQ